MSKQWIPNKASIDKPGVIELNKTDLRHLINAGNMMWGYFVNNFTGSMGFVA